YGFMGGIQRFTPGGGYGKQLKDDYRRYYGAVVGFAFQFFNLLPVLTAEENIRLPLSIAGRKPDAEWLDHLIEVVGLGDRRTHRPAELSGGQQQRVAVARALVSKPAVVFADEPTGNLDSKASDEVLSLLRHSVDELGQTVVMVTHEAHAAAYADRLVVLRDGRVAHDGVAGGEDDVLELMKAVA
ncbi:MAG TPA: ABC transporter ATP-binding protein, partial [Thermoleophilaceae bacterium]|nr:ABC transporter ATP-binding protein [Thermoleophilaceae bacterium]